MISYRHDIDGLRALAVVAVVLFHLDIHAFAGGYVGVDVFFVISGFLITSIVARKVEHDAFRLRSFYLRRVRRLLPPLLATVAVTSIGAAALLTPFDMVGYARSAVAAIVSLANVVFFAEAGYWDSSTDLKPLLHMWSLGVEEQFYAFWPLLVIGVVRIRRRIPVVASLVVVTVVGLAVSLWIYALSPEAAFYLLPARIYQFSIGALVGQVSQAWLADRMRGWRGGAVTGLGLALIVASILTFDATTAFPGVPAVLPTAGTALAIAGGVGGTGRVIGPLLENRPAQWLGQVSYAMYLAHWPVISLYRYATGIELDAAEQLGLALATVVGTVVLHHGVERRFYRRGSAVAPAGRASDGLVAARVLSVGAVMALVLVHPWVGDGWAWRTPDAVLAVDEIEAGQVARYDLTGQGCAVGRLDDQERCHLDRPIQVLVLGNSHEPDGYNFLHGAYGDRSDVNLISFGTTNDCGLERVDGVWSAEDPGCDQRVRTLLDRLAEQLDVIVYAANRPFAENKETELQLLADLIDRQPDVSIVTLGGWINTDVPCPRLINETGSSRACVTPEHVDHDPSSPEDEPLYDEFMAITDRFVDRLELLCSDPEDLTTCRTETATGVPMSYDVHHLSLEFAVESGRLFAASDAEPLLPPRSG